MLTYKKMVEFVGWFQHPCILDYGSTPWFVSKGVWYRMKSLLSSLCVARACQEIFVTFRHDKRWKFFGSFVRNRLYSTFVSQHLFKNYRTNDGGMFVVYICIHMSSLTISLVWCVWIGFNGDKLVDLILNMTMKPFPSLT